jgi:hypothetical protein
MKNKFSWFIRKFLFLILFLVVFAPLATASAEELNTDKVIPYYFGPYRPINLTTIAFTGSPTFSFPICDNVISSDCIDSVEYQYKSSKWQKAVFEGYTPVYYYANDKGSYYWYIKKYNGDLLANIAGEKNTLSAPDSRWTFPGVAHAGGNIFLLQSKISGFSYSNPYKPSEGLNALPNGNLDVSISPVVESSKTLMAQPGRSAVITQGSLQSCFPIDGSPGSGTTGLEFGPSYCLERADFPSDLGIKVRYRLSRFSGIFDSGNWLAASASSAYAKLIPSSETILELSGNPTSLFGAHIYLPPTQEAASALKLAQAELAKEKLGVFLFPMNPTVETLLSSASQIKSDNLRNYGTTPEFSGFEWPMMNNLSTWVSPKADYAQSVWRFYMPTLKRPGSWDISTCPRSSSFGLPGLMATNSTAPQMSVPSWNKEDNTLDFQAASPHLAADGSPIVGNYEIMIDKEQAICMWGNNLESSKIQVSITSPDGTSNLAISQFKIDDKYIYFNISGFHYSADTIKVSLIKGDPVLPGVTTAKQTLTCVKSKLIKKVIGIKPICPKGFSRKV